MEPRAHLWAIGYDSEGRADEVRVEVIRLGWGTGGPFNGLILDDVAVLVRHPDGTFSFDRDRHRAATTILGCTVLGLLAGLVMAAPLTGTTVGALLGGARSAVGKSLAIDESFIRGVRVHSVSNPERGRNPGGGTQSVRVDVRSSCRSDHGSGRWPPACLFEATKVICTQTSCRVATPGSPLVSSLKPVDSRLRTGLAPGPYVVVGQFLAPQVSRLPRARSHPPSEKV